MNEEVEDQRKVYHYLHNSASGAVVGKWQNDFFVFELPNPGLDTKAEYRLQIDPSDKRTLIVFDGHIPCDGLPKQGEVVLSFLLMELKVSENNVRRPRSEEERPIWHVFDDGKNQATLRINRYFLLLPRNQVACLRRYDDRILRGIYTFVEITDKKIIIQPKGITWRTSSY